MNSKQALDEAGEIGLSLTYDDVSVMPGYSEVMPAKVNTQSWFSRNVTLKIPVVSAAMDTVTESAMAIALAKLGGLGVLHRNMTPKEQASQVAKVKYHLNGLLHKPICVNEADTVASLLALKEQKKYSFSSFPVINSEGKLVGLITGTDIEFCEDKNLCIRSIMSTDLFTAVEGTSMQDAYQIMMSLKKKIMPLINDKHELKGMYVFSDLKDIYRKGRDTYNLDADGRLRVAAAIGTGEGELERVELLIRKKVDVLVIDTAHGNSKPVIEMLKEIKKSHSIDVVVGNISLGDAVRRLADAGADGLKVGQGGGSICTTRVVTGIGIPQVSAIYSCAREIGKYGIPLCADGGLRYPGDITKAMVAGADSVMVGNILAGTAETPGEVFAADGQDWKEYRGMGSLAAMQEHEQSKQRYGQRGSSGKELIPEGVETRIPYKGPVEDVIIQYVGGLRNGMGYVGAASIPELKEKGDFIRITNAGVRESHPHDVILTKQPPNYRK